MIVTFGRTREISIDLDQLVAIAEDKLHWDDAHQDYKAILIARGGTQIETDMFYKEAVAYWKQLLAERAKPT